MMLTIHGLSPKTRYQDLKLLIKQQCSINDFILDNLLDDTNGTKKVRVGLPDDNEGYKLMKCLDGYCTPGNFLLRVTPVGKPAASANKHMQDSYNPRQGYQPQRDDYPNQPISDYNRGPQGPSGILRPSGPYGPGGGPGRQQQGPVDNIRPPWSSNNNPSAPWGPNSSMTSQIPQNRFNLGPAQHNVSPGFTQQNPNHNQQLRPEFRPFDQGRQGPPSGPNYGGYQPESNFTPHQMDGRKNLRNIETIVSGHQAATPIHGGRYPNKQQYPLEKPVTILKDNFQGPTQYNVSHPSGQPNYTQQSSSQWEPQTHQSMSKGSPYERPFEGRNYPQEQTRDPKIYKSRIDASEDFDKRRGFSPSGRGDNAMQRRISPTRGKDGPGFRDLPGRLGEKRRISPDRVDDMNQRRSSPVRIGDGRDPQGRREDLHGKRYLPSEKRNSPGGRRNIPGPRHESPPRRMTPNRRIMSPTRKDDERRPPRFSPNRHHGDKITDKYELENKNVKKIRPAYEPVQAHAQNQAMYSGGYRPSIQENVQYSGVGMRQDQPAPWQRHREEPIIKKQEHDRMDERMPLARGRLIEKIENRYSPSRKSRSPNRRDRSPIRDRYKRNSRSPRSSHSPRRSWALEKRSSPEVPPPPIWPGQSDDPPKTHRFPEKDDKPVHQPIWEGRSFKEEELQSRRSNDLRQYDEAKIRIAKDLERNPPVSSQERNFQKFPARSEYNERRDNYFGRNSPHQKMVKDDLPRRHREESSHEDYSRGRTSPYRDTRKEINVKEFDKDFEDIYKRALQFKKKTEELKKTISKKSEEFEGNRRLNEKEREIMQPRYDGRHRYHDAESQPLRGQEERIEGKPRDDRAPRDSRLRDDRPRDDRPRDDRPRDDRPRDDRPRDDRPRDDRPRDDMPRDDRPRDDRPRDDRLRDDRLGDDRLRDDRLRDYMPRDDRFRDDRPQTERTKHFDDGRVGFQARDNQQECKKSTDDAKAKRIVFTDINVKNKRDRAVNEIAEKIIERNEEYKHVQGEQRKRILEELKLSVARIVYDMFGESDVSFIEVIIKYQAKYNLKDEEKLLQEVIRSLPQPVRTRKRQSKEPSDHPTKISRYPESTDLNPVIRRIPGQIQTRPQHKIIHKKPILRTNMPSRPRPPLAKPIQAKERETVKDAPKKRESVKMETTSIVKLPKLDKSCVGHCELNQLMTTMVDAELDDIMPKVQEELSGVISAQKDIYAGEAIIKKATDSLRNMLGLNVTKRLLNVYNSLYVKIKFHGQPSKEDLRQFLRKYHFVAFARKTVNIFAAKLRSIGDFDNLFSAKEVRCGPVKMTINPVYSFTTCPPNLITKYTTKSSKEESVNTDKNNEFSDVKTDVTNDKKTTPATVKISPIKTAPNTPVKETENVVNTAATTSKITAQSNTTKTETNVTSKVSLPVNATTKKEEVSGINKTPQKTTSATANKTTAADKTTQKCGIETSEKSKTSSESDKIQKSIKPALNAAVTSQKSINPSSKTAMTSQKLTNAALTTQKSAKPSSNTAVTPQKTTKPAATPQKSTKSVTMMKSTRATDDYDVLDDRDILALISEGIVLDECSGSEED